jgi:hypothetical protein
LRVWWGPVRIDPYSYCPPPASLTSDSGGGGAPCHPTDGRCAAIALSVQTRAVDETDPRDTWDHAQGGAFYNGGNEGARPNGL